VDKTTKEMMYCFKGHCSKTGMPEDMVTVGAYQF